MMASEEKIALGVFWAYAVFVLVARAKTLTKFGRAFLAVGPLLFILFVKLVFQFLLNQDEFVFNH